MLPKAETLNLIPGFQMRRPLASQVKDIGIWYNILEGMTYLSVGFNVRITIGPYNCGFVNFGLLP
jgi:hypothetical protein